MKINQNIALVGQKVVLVPYREEHVQTYHRWMTDPELRELTASEPLSLEEEFEMQRKWREDEDKLTFIILARRHDPTSDASSPLAADVKIVTDQRMDDHIFDAERMIGDVNLFLKGAGGDGDEDDTEAEVEIMIAEPAYRRRGCAFEALQLFLSFATSYTPAAGKSNDTLGPSSPPSSSLSGLPVAPSKLVVRIGEDNAPSISLFARMGFEVIKRVAVFHELEMRLVKPEEAHERWAKGEIKEFR